MQHHRFARPPNADAFAPPRNEVWRDQIFAAKAAREGGIIRRAVRDVEREIGREALELEVRRRGFHLLECGGQFLIICNRGHLRVIC
ncbi:MAG: hypothetical protein ACK4TB_11180 [Gemmobacter sp.]